MPQHRVLVDCDPGVDDALALCAVLADHHAATQAVTTVFGNVSVRQATRNVSRLLHLLPGASCLRIGEGSDQPLTGSRLPRRPLHGHDGLGDLGIPMIPVPRPLPEGTAVIAGLLKSGMLDGLIALGPLTNLAHAFATAPTAMRALQSITVTGGVLTDGTAHATEFNVASDPSAARCLLSARLALRWVPANVCGQALFDAASVNAFKQAHGASKTGRVIAALLRYLIRSRGDGERAACPDAVAMALALQPSLGRWQRRRIGLEGHARTGRVCVEPGLPNVQLCESIDRDGVAAALWAAWGRVAQRSTV